MATHIDHVRAKPGKWPECAAVSQTGTPPVLFVRAKDRAYWADPARGYNWAAVHEARNPLRAATEYAARNPAIQAGPYYNAEAARIALSAR